MFYLNKDIDLSIELINKMLNHFRTNEQPKLLKYKKYYDGLHAILNKTYSDDTKPCSHTVINYCREIADSYAGYMATPGYISYSSSEDIEIIMDVLKYNDYQTEDSDFLLDALVYGTAAELMYIDSDSQPRFRLINPTTCFGIYDDSLTGDLTHFVRWYKVNEWDDSDLYNLDVYSDFSIKHYTMTGEGGTLKFVAEEPHYFSQCPANIFTLPDEKSVFDCIISLQDGFNELVSSEIDDYSAFVDAYMVLMGVDADKDDIASMKENRVLVLPEGATANYLTKSANDAQIENILDRLHNSIYRVAKCPDFSSESFVGGVSSGIAIQYRLTGMENRAGTIEGRMKKALQRRIEVISGIATLKLGDEMFKDINIDFKRNIPDDITATINMINSLKGTVSDKTLLTQLPFVDDVEAELEALQEQKTANMALYSFGTTGTDDTEDDE